MKLKKVISLVLGGVMALSMLAGCSSSSTTTVTEEPTVNTGVVAYVQSNMGSSTSSTYNVGASQASQTLAGNESAHKAIAIKALNGNFDNVTYAGMVSNLDATTVGTALGYKSGESYVMIVRKAGDSDSDLAKAILNMLAARYSNAQSSDKTEDQATRYCIESMSVFDATIDELLLPTVTIDGSDIGYNEYWVVVTTNCTATTKEANKNVDNNTTVVE